MAEQPLLIALVAVQFAVHALGWFMAARLTERERATEGRFAIFWLLLAAGLMLYVPPWPSGSLPRNLGNLLIVASAAAQHDGMAFFLGRRVRLRGHAVLLLAAAALMGLSLVLGNGHGLRVAVVCVGVSVMLLATVHLIWVHGRDMPRLFSRSLAGGYLVLALVLLVRAWQALTIGAGTKISIDAPGHLNVPLAILVMFVGGLINLAQIRLLLTRVLLHLRTQALTDALTGLLNRRGLLQQLATVHARARQGGPNYVVLMVDVDHFKSINDELGHAAGDHVLARVAGSLRDGLRVGDMVARWGGEEFCVLLPRMRLPEAAALAERMAAQVAESGLPPVTVSIGVADAGAHDGDGEAVIRRADAALYRAKQSGRNRVVAAAPAGHSSSA